MMLQWVNKQAVYSYSFLNSKNSPPPYISSLFKYRKICCEKIVINQFTNEEFCDELKTGFRTGIAAIYIDIYEGLKKNSGRTIQNLGAKKISWAQLGRRVGFKKKPLGVTNSCVTFQTLYISSSIVDGYCNYDLGLQRVKSSNTRRICIKPRWQLFCHINIWLILFPFESNGIHNINGE